MRKHLFCAQFGGTNACEPGGISGKVTFVNWIPACARNSICDRQIQNEIDEKDACALWKFVTKVRDRSLTCDSSDDDSELQFGHLTVSQGSDDESVQSTPKHKRDVIGKLSASEADAVLQVIDFQRNCGARPAAV